VIDKILTYRDLEMYQKTFEAAMQIFELSKLFPREEIYSRTSQIRCSSRSVSVPDTAVGGAGLQNVGIVRVRQEGSNRADVRIPLGDPCPRALPGIGPGPCGIHTHQPSRRFFHSLFPSGGGLGWGEGVRRRNTSPHPDPPPQGRRKKPPGT